MITYPYQAALKNLYDTALQEPIQTTNENGEIFFFIRKEDMRNIFSSKVKKETEFRDEYPDLGSPMKDPNDRNKTLDLVEQIEQSQAPKAMYQPFQRFHITRNGKKTTVSIETLNAEFLALSLGATPHSKEAKQKIILWIMKRMNKSETYDKDAPYLFSQWLKREVLEQIVNRGLAKKRNQWLDSFF